MGTATGQRLEGLSSTRASVVGGSGVLASIQQLALWGGGSGGWRPRLVEFASFRGVKRPPAQLQAIT